MFEAHVLHLLRRYLGEYVHGLSQEALQISVWKGDVVLKDLQLKAEALNTLKLPVVVKAGFLGSITLKVPWKRLGKEPVIVLIDRVFVLAEPANDYSFMADDKERIFAAKRQKIEEAELAMLEARDRRKAKEESTQDTNSWFGSLIATIVGNLKISITNVHIRYEDIVSNTGHPFCFGITLAKLAAVTTDEDGKETFDTSGAWDKLCKSLQLERFSVYHNSNTSPWKLDKPWDTLRSDEWSEIFEAGIVETPVKDGHQYLLHPVNGNLKYFRIGRQEKRDESVPSQKMSLTVNDVSLTVTENQYRDGIKLLEGVSRYRARVEVSHLRPTVSVTKNPQAWWIYASQASLHQQNKMGLCRQHLSWKNVSRLCHLRRKYVQLYSTLLQQLPRVENKEISEIEKELDAKVILLWRLLAHVRVESVKSKELALERERARKSSWWNFGWGSTPKDVDASSISEISPQAVEEIPGQLTKDEWKKLNELLGYDPSEDLIVFPDNELPSTVHISIDATIGICAARIVNENDIEIICGKFENLQVGLKLYPKSMHCIVRLMSYGVSAPEGSLVQSIVNENNDYALTTAFVYSPMGENLDWKLSARMASCHIMVSMISIERWLQFIRRSNSLSPEVASETATALQLKLEKVTRRAQEHLQLVLEEQSRFSVDIDVDAPKVRIPFTGPTCTGSCSQLLVDFGHFRLCTMNENEVHTQSSSLYRRYLISGRDTTAFFIDGSFEWTNLAQIQFHSMHTEASSHQGPTGAFKLIPIIDKCGMCAMIDQIKVRHPSYPSLQVAIEVPNLGVHFSPARHSRILDLLTMFGSHNCGEDKPGGTGYSLGFSSWHPTDLEDDARVLFWGGIGNSVPEWKSCWLALSGSYLYVFESKASPTYQRCCSMNGRQVMEIPSVYVGGAEFTLAMSIRGSDLQKALESTSTVVLQFKDDNTKAKWLKSLVQATYKASAPMSMCIPGDSGDDSEDENSQSVDAPHKTDLFVIGSLVEMKLLVYGKVEDKIDSGDEGMLLEVRAGGGKVRVTQEGGDLTVTMKLHTLMIEDKVQGSVSRTTKYIACSVLDDQSHEIFEEVCDACSPMSTPNAWEEDDNFKDALTDFNCLSESGGVLGSNSVPSTPRETINKLAVEIGQVNGEDDDQSGFVCVTLATKQPDSPSYDGIDTQMLIRMAKLDFFCNRSTVVSLIDFGMELSELTEKSYSIPGLQSTLEMDSLGTADNKYANERSVVKGLLGIGKSRIVFQLKMNVDSVCIYLNKEDGSQLAMLVQQKFQLDLNVHPSSVSIEGLLGNLRICDMSNGPCHCWGWLCDIRDAKCDSLVKWKFQSFSRGDDDYEGYDYCFIGKLSAVRIVFLYRFVQEVLVYFYGLATPQAQQVIQVVDKVGGMEWLIQQSDIEGSSALKLDVCLDAPVIIMPEDSTSKNFIQFDLGYLKLSNNFEWHGGNENEPSAVHLDVLNAQITDMNMIVGIDGQLGKPMIQEACGLHLTVSRSLRDIFKRVPEVAIDIKIEMLHGVMSDKEYKIIIDCIFSNISEEPHLVPNIRTIPERTLNTFDVERNSMKSTQDLTACEDQKSSLEGSSYTLSFWTVEIESASLDLYTGMDRESPLAQMNLQGLWVAYRTSSLSEVDLYVTLSKLSILDIRPATKAEMRLMLGSVTDVEKDESQRDFQVSTESSTPSLTMLVVDWRVKQDSQAFVIRMQQPCVLVVLDFILAVGEFFVPSLGAVTGREDTMDIQNDPLTMHDHIRLNTSFYEQKEEIVYLSSQRKLVADAYNIDEFTYDGCGHTICLVDNVVSKGCSSAKPQPVIVIGYGKNLILKNVRIQNASRLRDCIYLSCESSFSASIEDNVIIDSSDMTDKELKTLTLTNRDAEEGSNAVPERYANNFIVELQAVAPELTFYDSTKWSSDSNWKGERFLRAKLDINAMYAAKDNDRWIRALVKGLTVDSDTGLAVLDPMDISGEYSCVQDKHNISVVSTDMYIHLSLSVLRLLLRLQDETAAALQFGSANALSFCTHFDKIWSYKQSQSGNDLSQHITIWRPRPPSNYAILGDCITIGHVPPSQAVMAVSKTYGRVKKPVGFNLIWSFLCVDSLEAELEISDEDLYCSLWMPVAPEGYTAVGCVGGSGKTPPSSSIVHCIRSDLLTSSKFSDCLFMMHHDERGKNDFSIWRIENSFGSFIGHASVKPPMRTVMCDLREMLRQQINSSVYHESTNDGSKTGNDGSNEMTDSSSSGSRLDRTLTTTRSGRYYLSTPQFEFIWWDKDCDPRQAVSIWRPVPPAGYAIIGDSIVDGLDPPALGVVVRDDDSGRVANPTSFKKTHLHGKGVDEIFIWYPTAPPGYVALGCIVTKSEFHPSLNSIRCVRMDLVSQTNISKKAVWPVSTSKGSYSCNLWRIENQASTFIAKSDLKQPPSFLAYGLVEGGKGKSMENLTAEFKFGCLSLTLLENLSGMVTPLVDLTLTGTNLAAHGRFNAVNAVLISSVAASTFNAQLEAWEPLVEPFDGIFKFETYDSSNNSPLKVGSRVRITATNVVNVNFTSANTETMIGLILAWRKQEEHEQQARLAAQFAKDIDDLRTRKSSALEQDNTEKVIVENRLGCDLYYKQFKDDFNAIELLKPEEEAVVHLPPPRFPDRLNAVTDTKASRYYVSVHILDATGLILNFNGIKNNFFCALRLVTTNQVTDGQKPFPQSARSRCVRPLLSEKDNLLGLVNWNEVFIFEVPHQGNTHLEVVITNLSAKAGKGEAVGMISVPIHKEVNSWLSQTCLPQAMQQASSASAQTFRLQPLRRKGSSNLVNDCSDIGSISLTTMYLISKRHMVVEGDGNDGFDGDEVGFKVAVNPGGPWACIRSILPLTTTLPQELGKPLGLEIAMKEGQKYAILRSLVTVANDTDIIIEVCICPLSLLRSPDIQPGNNSNKSTVVTEEVFENQCYNPLSGWGNRWPTFLMSKDPGRWSTNDYSVSSKDFLEISLPPGWKWTSDWFVDKSQFVDNEGWAYGPNVQSLIWPLSSIKSCKRSPADFVRRRRWIRTRQRISNADLKNRREVVAVLNPGCSASLPWKCSEQRNDLCVQVRPFSESTKVRYAWGISILNSTGTSGTSSQSNIERSPTSKSFVRQSKSRTTASLFMLNRLDKAEELIKCSPENGSNNCCWFNVIVDDNVLDRQVMSPVYDWKVTVSAPLILENKLPCNAEYILWQKSNDGNNTSGGHGLLSSGSSVHIYSVDIYKPIYLTWLAEGGWETEKELFLVWDPSVDTLPSFFWMRHDQTKRKVRVSVERDFGETDAAVKAVSFFVPYWICNDTDFPLAYHLVEIEPSDNTEADTFLLSRAIKAAKQASNPQSSGLKVAKQTVHKVVQILEHLEDTNGVPAMLSPQTYLGKSGFPTFSSKEEEYMLSPRLGIAVTISKSNIFSHGISFSDLDRKEHVDIKAFNSNDEYCRLSSFVDMASERTKVVHFQAHMLFVNRVGQKLWLKQEGSPRHEVILPSGPPKAILWKSSLRTELLKASLDEHNWSCPFSVSGEGVIHVNMKGTYDDAPFYLRAEVVNGVKKSRFLIIFQHVSTSSPYRIENRCMVLPLRIRQAGGADSSWNLLLPLSSSAFAWEDFSREHLLEVIVDGSDPKKSFRYNIDVLGDQRPSSNLSSPVQALCLSVYKEGTVNVVKITEWLPSNDYGAIVPYGQVALPSTHEHSSYVECDNQVHVIIELAEFGLSVVDHTPEELLYLSIQNLIVSYASDLGSGTSRFKLRLDGLQIDNQIPLTPMPVLFRPHGTNQLGTLLKFTMTMQNCGSTDSYIYSYLGIQGPNSSGTVFMVKIHEPVIWRLHEMIHKLNFGRLTASETKDVAIDPIIRIGLLNISEIRFKLSLAMSPTQRPRGVLGFWSSLMTALSNTENMPIRISSRVHQNISMRQSAMISAASSNIRKDLLSQPLQLLYGLDILGNASSALGHMSKGVAALSMDKKFIQSRQRQDHKGSVEDIGDVIREGGGALAKGLFRGVTGILTKPYEGARSSGVEGFVQGVGKGIIGVAAQPVSGVLDLLSKTTEGANAMRMKIAAAITSEEQTLRHRLPRAIGGDKVLQPFDEFRAQGQALLQLAERGSTFSQLELFKVRGKFAFSDAYEDHFNLPKGRVVIITNHRVILLQRKNDSIKEPCSILWDVTWDDLLAIEPTYGKRDHQGSAPSQLVLILRPCQQESKIFESKEVNRVIKCHPKSTQAEEVRSAIQRAKSTYGSKGASVQLQELDTRKVRKPYAGITTGAYGGSGTSIGMFPGFAAPIAIPVMATFGALLGTTAGQAMVDSDAAASSDARHGQRKDSERGLVSTNFSPSSGKIINQLAPVWSDQRTPWSNERRISFWRPLCPNGYIFVGDVLQLSHDPPSSAMVYANKSNGKFIHPTGFDLVWRNPDSRSRDPLTIWMPRAPPGYVSIGCVVVPDYYEPDPSLVCCVRKDAVKMVDFARFPIVRDSRDADKAPCTIWRVRNDAHTFLARRDQQQQPPPQDLAFNVIT